MPSPLTAHPIQSAGISVLPGDDATRDAWGSASDRIAEGAAVGVPDAIDDDRRRSHAAASPRRILMELTKARLTAMVLVTTAVGAVMASPTAIAWTTLLVTIIGTALAASCASILNQVMEVDRDRLMSRTRNRPLPSGAVRPLTAVTLAALCGWAGVMILALWAHPLAAALALGNILLYAFVYTPLKTRTTLNTLVGAVTGAIPPMIGWAAVAGELGIGAWVLAAILFVWQLPHFLALAWMYRDDYRAGGFVMLPSTDPRGRLTAEVTLLTALLLIPVGLLPFLTGLAGPLFAIGALVLGGAFVGLAVRQTLRPTDAAARAVFLASIVYLPVVLGLMVADRGPLLSPGPPVISAAEPIAAGIVPGIAPTERNINSAQASG